MEDSTKKVIECAKCTDVMLILQYNEQMIQEQVKLIKQLHQQNIKLKEQCLRFQTQNRELIQKQKERLELAKLKVQEASQTDNLLEDLLGKINELTVETEQLRKNSKRTSKANNDQSRQRQNLINKENLQKILPIVTMRKDEQYFSRKRKNSNEQEHHTTSWRKVMDCTFKHDQQSFRSKTVDLVKKFVPHEIRHIVWPSISKNILMITEQLYFQLLQRKNLGWVSKEVKALIDKDISRSFLGKNELAQKEGLKIQISQVLQMFHLYRPDISYIQGMTYPIIVLTLVTGKVKAFRMFANLVLCNNFFRKLYTFESNFIHVAARAFQLLLLDYQSQVAQKLANQKIDPNIFLIEWFYTIFSRSFSFDTTLKFWDHLLYFGEVVLYRVALSVIELIKGHIMETDQETTLGLIQGFSGFIREDKLLELMVNHKLTHQKLYKTFEKVERCLPRSQ